VGWTDLNRFNSAGLHEENTFNASLKFTHVINPNSFYDVIVNHFNDFYIDMDPFLQHNIVTYGDSIVNADLGRRLRRDGEYTVNLRGYGLTWVRNDRPFNLYRKQKTMSWGGKANFLYQLGKHHEFKTGGEFTYYTIRRYSIAPVDIASNQKGIADGDIRGIYDRLDNYGYDVFGNALDEGQDGPKNPVFAAFYIQDKMEFSDLVVQLGFRLDYIDIDSKTFADPSNVPFDSDGIIDESQMVDLDPFLQVSPRLGFSFPVTDRTVFHAQYGHFVQQSRLRDVYLGANAASDVIKGGFAESNPVGYGLRPERTTSYEIGFRQQVGDNFAFDLTGFYKDIKDQIQIRPIFADPTAQHTLYYAFVNGDFSTTRGFELKLDLRRTNRLAATIDYTFSDAQGTGSTPNTAFRTIWQSPTDDPFFPQQIAPLTFNQSHRGAFNLDYRFGQNDGGPILSQLGLNALFTFTSGFNYTRWNGFGNARTPTESLNSSTTPWTFQLDMRLDKSFGVGPFGFNVYIWAINVLNTENIVSVFNTSGDAYDDGWLADPQGSARTEGYRRAGGDEAAQTYEDLYLASIYNPANFGTPRQIRLGIRINY
jgi:outer membrane receptor protein involved in Fe transport